MKSFNHHLKQQVYNKNELSFLYSLYSFVFVALSPVNFFITFLTTMFDDFIGVFIIK